MNESEPEQDKAANSNESEIEIFHRVNRLKIKAGGSCDSGPGKLDPHAVERAQTVIETSARLYDDEIKSVLQNLSGCWENLNKGLDKADDDELERLYNYANQAKDLAATFCYPLMQHFGLSLREFIEVADLTRQEHHIIIQAHVDAMWAVYYGGIKDHGDKSAEELKLVVSKAIEKYS